MPLYDYDCANCGQRSEVLRGVHDVDPTSCPLCGGGPLKKAFAAPAIHFKGSGWAKKERRATATPGASKASGDGGSTKDGASSHSASDASSGSTSSADGAPASSSESKGKPSGGTADSSSTKTPSSPSGSAATSD